MTIQDWINRMNDRDIHHIGLSNGFTYISKVAKKYKKLKVNEFLSTMLTEISTEIKRIDTLPQKTYPVTYKEAYKLALSMARLDMLQQIMRPHLEGGDDDGDDSV